MVLSQLTCRPTHMLSKYKNICLYRRKLLPDNLLHSSLRLFPTSPNYDTNTESSHYALYLRIGKRTYDKLLFVDRYARPNLLQQGLGFHDEREKMLPKAKTPVTRRGWTGNVHALRTLFSDTIIDQTTKRHIVGDEMNGTSACVRGKWV